MYVADSSFFVSATAVNPTLTIIANALRVADTITQRRGRTTFQAQPANQGLPVITEMAVTGWDRQSLIGSRRRTRWRSAWRQQLPGSSLPVMSHALVVQELPRGNLSDHIGHMSARDATGFPTARHVGRS